MRAQSAFLVASLAAVMVAGLPGQVLQIADWPAPAVAAEHSGGHAGGGAKGGGHDSGTDHEHDEGDDHGSGGQGGAGKGKRYGPTTGGGGHSLLEDKIFHDDTHEIFGEEEDHEDGKRGPRYMGGGAEPGGHGEEEEESDRPEWAGTGGGKPDTGRPAMGGGKRGDLFGDLWIILRDETGVPILDDRGFVQPLDAAGNPIPLDDEGKPIDETLVVEVELGRLNVARAPTRVLDNRLAEAIALLEAAASIGLDPAGRFVIKNPDGTLRTIDSPLENLALYLSLMQNGSLGLNVPDEVLDPLAHLNDGALTKDDYVAAASLLAAASDKSGTLTVDEIVYLNSFLSVPGTIEGPDGRSYVDYSAFTYDRVAAFDGVTAYVLVLEDGKWVTRRVNILDVVPFTNSAYVPGDGGVSEFAQAADDARAVIEYLHEYAVPITISSTGGF